MVDFAQDQGALKWADSGDIPRGQCCWPGPLSLSSQVPSLGRVREALPDLPVPLRRSGRFEKLSNNDLSRDDFLWETEEHFLEGGGDVAADDE